jgi:hypothetical protein
MPCPVSANGRKPISPHSCTKEECKTRCIEENGIIDSWSLADRNNTGSFSEDDIEVCISRLIEGEFATCGVKSTSERTNELITLLRRKYGYVPFVLKRTVTNDPASECQVSGWEQGTDDSDCWIDSFFFSIFANNNLSNRIMKDINSKYTETNYLETPSIVGPMKEMNNAIYFINLYLNLLTNREETAKKIARKSLDVKGACKWCCVWSILQYFKATKSPDYYASVIQPKVSLKEGALEISAGGDPGLLSLFLSEVTPIFKTIEPAAEYKKLQSIPNKIDTLPDIAGGTYVAVPFFLSKKPEDSSEDKKRFVSIEKLKSNKYILEAINIGYVGHATAITRCNKNWRYYDNKASPTTETMETMMRVAEKLDPLMINRLGTQVYLLFIYRIASLKGGKTRKQKGKQKRRQTRRR